jgi:hypothetical protein
MARARNRTIGRLESVSRYSQEYSILHVVQTGSRAHPAIHLMGTRVSFPVGKTAACEADYLPPTSAEVKRTWIFISIPIELQGVELK